MKKHLLIIILFQCLIALSGRHAYAQKTSKSLPPSFATKIPPGPWCVVMINNQRYTINCRLIDSLIKLKSIKSLKVENEGSAAAAAIYGYRAGNGMVVIEIERRYWKSEFPKLKSYLKDL
jgi:hypothetical protein